MVVAKPVRVFGLLSIVLVVFLILTLSHGPRRIRLPMTPDQGYFSGRDPLLDEIGEPPEPLWRADDYAVDNPNSPRINATILSLVRNSELNDLLPTIQQLESHWNHKFNYPWTFLNDEPFTDEFKRETQALIKAPCSYHTIPEEDWAVPEWISDDIYAAGVAKLKEDNVQYSGKKSYHQMCRWNSGRFYHHPALKDIRYYWRVEPQVKFFCDIDYDVFRYMQDHNKTYGFNINLYDSAESLPTLWPETLKFLEDQPESLHPNNAWDWLVDDSRPDHNEIANGYSTCHFWSNFEIADMNFWRSKVYEDYFAHLDRAGGFFYERWGDAPVHSIALALFEDKSKIHWFKDIGYNHIPYLNCPNSPKCHGCTPGKFYEGASFLAKEDCRPSWFNHVGMD